MKYLLMNQFIKYIVESFDFNNAVRTFLDKYLKGNNNDNIQDEVIKTNAPIIYAFTTSDVPDAIKIGYTDQGAIKRIQQWKQIYNNVNLLGYWTSREFNKQAKYVFFKDFPVHKKVIDRGHYNLTKEDFEKLQKQQNLTTLHVSREFFRKINDKTHNDKDMLSVEVIAEIIKQMKEEIRTGNAHYTLYELLSDGTTKYADKVMPVIHMHDPTPLQDICIQNGVNAIKEGKIDLLMAAVMRFGKTFATYEIIKQSGLKYILVTSAKADVRSAWRNEISHKDFIDNFVFIEFDGPYYMVSKKNEKDGKIHTSSEQTSNLIAIERGDALYPGEKENSPEVKKRKNQVVIIFATLQDLAGKHEKLMKDDEQILENFNIIKEKHLYLFNNPPELMVIDEAHFGTHSNKFGEVTGLGSKSKNKRKDNDEDNSDYKEQKKEQKQIDKYIRDINPKITMQCSGTPYYILASDEFDGSYNNKAIISDVSYTDMIQARDNWVKENPKADESTSPYYGIPNIYKFGMNLTTECQNIIKEYNMSEKMSKLFEIKGGKFVHEHAIKGLMMSIYGKASNSSIGFLNTKKIEDGEIFKHTIMVLPHIETCKLLNKFLIEENIIDLDKREIIVAVNDNSTNYSEHVKNSDALNAHLKELEEEGKHSIILTVNRFLTGTTIPLADSMLYMKDTRSVQSYDQEVFRICSRNIAKAKDMLGNVISVNRKSNVYLIDFNIARMFQMTMESAQLQAKAKGETDITKLEEYVNQIIDTIPTYTDDSIYDENGNEILGKMHEIGHEDFLKLYVKYNSERSIEDIIDNALKGNMSFTNFLNTDNTELLANYKEDKIGGGFKVPKKKGQDDMEFKKQKPGIPDPDGNQKETDSTTQNNNGTKSDTDTAVLETLKKKFKSMLKTILYCNICYKQPAKTLNDFIKKSTDNQDLLKDFDIDMNNITMVYNHLDKYERLDVDSMLYQIYIMLTDKSLKPLDRVQNAIHKLGKIERSEVVTPEKLVDKMVDKLDVNNIKNAESILLVNEKTCEFFMGLHRKFKGNKSIMNKCRIVPSGAMTRNFCKKIIKQLGLSETIILDIGDLDGNGKYDIKDFLEMKNSELLKMNQGKKFDIILANPPFNLGEKMLTKWFDLADIICTVQPSTWLLGKKKTKSICSHLDSGEFTADIESINGNEFFDTGGIGGVMAVQFFEKNALAHNEHYVKFDGKEYTKTDDIKSYSNDEYLVELQSIMKPLYTYDNLNNYLKGVPGSHYKALYCNNPNPNWYCVKIPRFAGSGNIGHSDDSFYTIFSKNININDQVNTYKRLIQTKKFDFYIVLNSENECINFFKYCKGFICRAMLLLNKTNIENVGGGTLKTVPMFDFSDKIFSGNIEDIDIALCKKYNISQDIVNHLITILPNYYNLDLSKYTLQ